MCVILKKRKDMKEVMEEKGIEFWLVTKIFG